MTNPLWFFFYGKSGSPTVLGEAAGVTVLRPRSLGAVTVRARAMANLLLMARSLGAVDNIYPELIGMPVVNLFDLDRRIVNDGSDVTDRMRAALEVAYTERVVVYIPAGDYGISDQLMSISSVSHQPAIRGEGCGRTRFKILNAITEPDDVAVALPIFDIQGPSAGNRQSLFWMDSIGFITHNSTNLLYQPFRFKFAGYTHLTDIRIRNVLLTALDGESWWDSTLTRVEFISGGTIGTPMVYLKDSLSIPPIDFDNCNNIDFQRCRFENIKHCIQFGEYARDNTVFRCKFEGNRVGIHAPGISKMNSVKECTFRAHGSHGIELSDSAFAWRIMDNTIDANGGAGIVLGASTYMQVKGNAFAPLGNNNGGNWTGGADATNQITGNTETPH